jgi:sugar phosphate isomerase/epimerase
VKIGCISWSYKSEFSSGKWNIRSWMIHCRDALRLDGVELWNKHFESTKPSYVKTLRAISDQLGLPVYSVAAKLELGTFSEQTLKAAEDTFAEWVGVAKALGCRTLRFSLGGEGLRESPNREKTYALLDKCMSVHQNSLHDLKVGIENQEPGFTESVSDVKELRRRLGGKMFLVLDNGSFRNKEVTYDFTKRSLSDTCLVHVKFYKLEEGRGDAKIDYDRYIRLLDSEGYDGFLSIEFDSDETPSVAVPRIADYLRKELGRVSSGK